MRHRESVREHPVVGGPPSARLERAGSLSSFGPGAGSGELLDERDRWMSLAHFA
jgi:hypothetical protein